MAATTVPHIAHTVDRSSINKDAERILDVIRPNWNVSDVAYKLLTDGITNVLVSCRLANDTSNLDVVLIRIYGNKTDMLIDRTAEKRNILLLQKVELAPALYATFENGIAYEYVAGCTLSPETVVQPSIYKLVAATMAKMHGVQSTELPKNPMLWTKFDKFLKLVPDRFHDNTLQKRFEQLIKSKTLVENEVHALKENITNDSLQIVFGHNDVLLGNVIYNKENETVNFIDFEYAGYNYQAFDIGNHFCEFVGLENVNYALYPSKDFQYAWLREYLSVYQHPEPVTKKQIHQLYLEVNRFALASHLFWGVWALIQAEYSEIYFDYMGYAAVRIDEYFKRKEEFLNIK